MKDRLGLRLNNDITSDPNNQRIQKYCDYLVEWIRLRVKKARAKGLVVGISGGIDSALVAALAKRAFPENTLGIVMPIDNMEHDLGDIKQLSSNIGLDTKTINLHSTFSEISAVCNVENKMALSNIKPRIRMAALYAIAQQNSYLVAGTDNEDEMYIGYFTKYGDGGVDILPISRLLKNEVKLMAKYLNIPDSIINKKPSAGLWAGQNDEDELGFSYDELDNYLNNRVELLNIETKTKIKQMHKATQHKRCKPYQPKTIEQFLKEN
ncbi:NH(3)-dependent NAD(+) synthetase [Mycoplasmopsis californica]|uniref:NH(3)-dependent NAD(+) synthetase n=1 Tax=Mycoplasmopsis californica TaxID=2113 RepID=A0A059XSM9_9BACT|nr:NAD(+) synthase [Mycoplasmopsis californica]AIA29788.1 NH(3)-dependent NAD(+) synthetase [Mycoplasmopsis californica]